MEGYLWITGISFLVLMASSIFGGDDAADADVGDSGSDTDNGGDGPNILSIRNVTIFFLGFGATGAIVFQSSQDHFVAVAAGAITGAVMAALFFFAMTVLYRQQCSSDAIVTDSIGKDAQVTVAIMTDSIGQVKTTNRYGSEVFYPATASGGEYSVGRSVVIIGFSGATAVVASAREQIL